MSFERKAIRHAVVDLLKGKTAAADNVFASRMRPIQPEELPCIAVYTRSEESVVFDQAPKRYQRTVKLVVSLLAQADEAVDDALDDMAEIVENAIAVDDTLGGTCADLRLADVETNIDEKGEQLIAGWNLTFDVEYYKDAPLGPADGADLPADVKPFTTANVEADLAPADGNIDATDTVQPQQ